MNVLELSHQSGMQSYIKSYSCIIILLLACIRTYEQCIEVSMYTQAASAQKTVAIFDR